MPSDGVLADNVAPSLDRELLQCGSSSSISPLPRWFHGYIAQLRNVSHFEAKRESDLIEEPRLRVSAGDDRRQQVPVLLAGVEE
jgi:hypothetical protein